jgi:hypothetical protein
MAALSSQHGDAAMPDTMLAANEPATPWPGSAVGRSLPASFTPIMGAFTPDQAFFMAPIMVQLLAALDPLPHAASLINDGPQLRRSDIDSI